MISLYQSGQGYEGLGMESEARHEYNLITADNSEYLAAQLRLIHLGFFNDQCASEADRGLELLKKHPKSGWIISDTAQCLHHAGRTREAYELMLKNWEYIEWDANEIYGMSCFASVVGEWTVAAEGVIRFMENDKEADPRTFLDGDLEPLWQHGAFGQMSEEVALSLGHPLFLETLIEVEKTTDEIPIDYLLRGRVPSMFRGYLVPDCESTLFGLSPRADISMRRDYLAWQRREFQRDLELAFKCHVNAEAFILNREFKNDSSQFEKATIAHQS